MWFDEMTKALVMKTSRRQAFKLLAAGLGGSILGLLGLEPAWAATTDCKDMCAKMQESAKRTCQSHQRCLTHFTCGPDNKGSCGAEAKCGPCPPH
jgi:hypothetical protein